MVKVFFILCFICFIIKILLLNQKKIKKFKNTKKKIKKGKNRRMGPTATKKNIGSSRLNIIKLLISLSAIQI